MTIEKRGDNYRISETRNGIRRRVTLDHEPGKREAKDIMNKAFGSYHNSMVFSHAVEVYIKSKENILSPATIRGYRGLINNISETIMNMQLDKITLPVLQTFINEYSASHSPKSVRNMNGFIVAVLNYNGAEVKTPRLPQKEKKDIYIPTEEDVKRILQEFKGHRYEGFIILATMGLRRSEICALGTDDLKGNVLTINKALVQNDKKEWVIKTTKTEASTRSIIIPDELVKILNERGFYEGNPENLYFNLQRAQKRLGIPQFPLHKLRHFFVSYMHNLGYTDKQIQEMGGWASTENSVMKSVYQHAMEMNKVKTEMANSIGSLMSP